MPERKILREEIADYLDSFEPESDELLRDMEAYADENDVPIAAREVARLQRILALSTGAERVLEVGTAIGYSTVQVARTGCKVVTLERDPERIEKAREYVGRAGVGDKVEIVEGDALDSLRELETREESFELSFVDAKKEEYEEYLDRVVVVLEDRGTVLVDNLLWYGQVAYGPADESYRTSTDAIREFNQYFTRHESLESMILPLGDGTGIGVKTDG